MFSFIALIPYKIMAALPDGCNSSFFGIPPWYKYLPMRYSEATGCTVDPNFQLLGTGSNSGLLLIGLALVDMALRVAGLVAVGYVLWGGFTYLTSQGSPEATTKARNTIMNALIGLVISIIATSLVVFIGSRLAA